MEGREKEKEMRRGEEGREKERGERKREEGRKILIYFFCRGSQIVLCQLEVPLEVTIEALKIAKEEGVSPLLCPIPPPSLPSLSRFCRI